MINQQIRNIENLVLKAFENAKIRSVLVAVSGGADSVALLRACARVASRLSMRIEAVNCNFHLRGAESDRDSAFTAALCKHLRIPLHTLDYDVKAYLIEHPGISTEMACRELRYSDFFRICREAGLERVAVAHNADDDIETMMMNLLRGCGTRGLRGMDIDNGRIIRPLLGVTRADIETYLAAIGQDFIIDSSNISSDYRRNFIRHDVIPLLESRWNGARKSLSRTLSIMKEESEIVNEHYRRQLADLCPHERMLLVHAEGVQTGTILRFLEPFGGNTNIAHEIIESLGKQHGQRRWRLSDRYEAALERDRLTIIDRNTESMEPTLEWEKLTMTPKLMAEIRQNRSHDIVYLPQKPSAYELRRPRNGDRMAPLGMKGTRLVSDIISDAQLDSRSKECIRVLTRRSDGEIIWVTGLKRSRHDLISPEAECVYKAVYNNCISTGCLWKLQ